MVACWCSACRIEQLCLRKPPGNVHLRYRAVIILLDPIRGGKEPIIRGILLDCQISTDRRLALTTRAPGGFCSLDLSTIRRLELTSRAPGRAFLLDCQISTIPQPKLPAPKICQLMICTLSCCSNLRWQYWSAVVCGLACC